jgi:resuscitation-promoting factor RpfB
VRRSAKLGLYAAVLLGLIGGSIAWFGTQKSVTVVVEGKAHHVKTMAATVGGVLRDAKLTVGRHDVVAPSATSRLHSGTVVQLRRGRLLELNIDGFHRQVWTTDTTVDQALAHLGYGEGRPTGVSRSQRLPLTPTQISLVMPKRITVVADHARHQVSTTAMTVGDVLAELSLNVSGYDKVSVPLTTQPTDGLLVVVKRVRLTVHTVTVKMPFRVISHKDSKAYTGTTKVIKAGRSGIDRVTYQYVYLDGKLVGKRRVWVITAAHPRTQVQTVGTKTRPSTGGSSGYSPTPVGEAQQIAKQLVTARGWDGTQFGCLVNLWNRESHWNTHAGNPVSGAYGIPQALPGSKMASAGPDWQNNATTQIKWGLGYIASRYSTPCGAWAHSQATGWY